MTAQYRRVDSFAWRWEFEPQPQDHRWHPAFSVRTRSPLPGQVWRTYAARRVARSRTSSSATSESVTRGNCT